MNRGAGRSMAADAHGLLVVVHLGPHQERGKADCPWDHGRTLVSGGLMPGEEAPLLDHVDVPAGVVAEHLRGGAKVVLGTPSTVEGDAHALDVGKVIDRHPPDGRGCGVAFDLHLVEVDEAAVGAKLELAEGVAFVGLVGHGVPPGVVRVRVP